MPNGYTQAPLLFTKILKQPSAALRRQGLLSVVYLDDSYLQGDSCSHCLENIHATTSLLTDLAFKINYEKSMFTPMQTIRFLGFLLDSVKMIISFTEERKICIVAICRRLQEAKNLKTEAEIPHHITALELHAAYLILQALGAHHTNVHIRLMLDTTATVHINKMGDMSWVEYSPKSKRNKLRAYWCCHCGLLSHGSLLCWISW